MQFGQVRKVLPDVDGSLFPEPESTSSITPRVMSPLSPELGGEDWRRAKGALAIALDPQGSGSSVSWDNPDTDMKGNFAPVGQPFVKTDEICRAFLGLRGHENLFVGIPFDHDLPDKSLVERS